MRLLERAEHLAVLGDAADAARSSGQLVLVSGEAGIGKSALVDAFCEVVPTDARVLVGRCDDLFAPRPLGPLSDIARDLGGPLRAALDAGDQPAAFDAFLDALSAAGPTIVVLEDLQWADDPTLDLVRFTARRLDRTRCLVIATHRNDMPIDHPLRRTIGGLSGAGVHRLALDALSLGAVRTLADGKAIDPVALHDATGGNPFFVVEVLASEPWTIPATVRDAVLARAAELTQPARDALAAAAVLGASASVELVMSLAECPADAVVACMAAGLLDDHGARVAFRHELARLAIEESLTPWRRRALHGHALVALGADADVSELANHAVAAGDRESVLALAPVAAAQCAALGANRAAAALYGSAVAQAEDLAPSRQRELYEAFARASKAIGAEDDAEAAGVRVLELLRSESADPLVEGRWLAWLSSVRGCSASVRSADATMREALLLLEPLGDTVDLAQALATMVGRAMLASDAPRAVELGERALPMAERSGDEELAIRVLDNMGTAMAVSGDPRGVDFLEEALERAERATIPQAIARACNNLGTVHNACWQPDKGLGYLERGIRVTSDHEIAMSPGFLLSEVGLAHLLMGQWPDAEAALSASLADLTPGPDQAYTLVVLAALRVRRGDGPSPELLDSLLEHATTTEQLQFLHPVLVARAERAWLAGDVQRARAETEALVPHHHGHYEPWRRGELALWCHRTGVALPFDDPIPPPFALHIDGHHRDAAALWDERGCRYAAADALADSDEEADLRAALEILQDLGAAPRAGQVTRRLRELGARTVPRGPRAATRANPAGLTAREAEVAGLLSEGLSNAAIAERLVVSSKTVDHHVSAVLAKLAVPSRREVATALAGLGWSTQDGVAVGPR